MTLRQVMQYFMEKDESRSPRTAMAEMLGVSPQYIHKMITTGHIPDVVQLRLHIKTRGELKADSHLL